VDQNFYRKVIQLPLQQLSVLMENRPGSMAKVLSALGEETEIFALSIAESGEFGLVRFIVSDPDKASERLEMSGFNLAKSKRNAEVTGVLITDETRASKVARVLAEGGVNIEYAYSSSFPVNGRHALILRTDDVQKAEEILTNNGAKLLSQTDLERR
jgi:hypothetical protein